MWTKELDYALAFGIAIGMSRSQIAYRLNLTRNAVCGRAHRLGLHSMGPKPRRSRPDTEQIMTKTYFIPPPKSRSNVAWTQTEKDKLKEMALGGASDKEIAKALNRTVHAARCCRIEMRLLRHKAGVPWTQEEDETLQRMRKEGATYADIAQTLGRSLMATYDRAMNTGLRKKNLRRFTPEDDNRIRLLYADNVPVEDIATTLGRGIGSMRQRIMRLKLYRASRKTSLAKRFGKDVLALSDDPDEILRLALAKQNQAVTQREADFHSKVQAALDLMDQAIAKGEDRRSAMQGAMVAGATLQQIGNRQGITRERVRQIVHGVKAVREPVPPRQRTCKECGAPFEEHGRRVFCSECRPPANERRPDKWVPGGAGRPPHHQTTEDAIAAVERQMKILGEILLSLKRTQPEGEPKQNLDFFPNGNGEGHTEIADGGKEST